VDAGTGDTLQASRGGIEKAKVLSAVGSGEGREEQQEKLLQGHEEQRSEKMRALLAGGRRPTDKGHGKDRGTQCCLCFGFHS